MAAYRLLPKGVANEYAFLADDARGRRLKYAKELAIRRAKTNRYQVCVCLRKVSGYGLADATADAGSAIRASGMQALWR